jgi:hypothetical protein
MAQDAPIWLRRPSCKQRHSSADFFWTLIIGAALRVFFAASLDVMNKDKWWVAVTSAAQESTRYKARPQLFSGEQ